MAVCRYMVTCPKWPECRHGGFTARHTLLPGSQRASPASSPPYMGLVGTRRPVVYPTMVMGFWVPLQDVLESRGSVSSDHPPLESGSSDDGWGPGPGPGRPHAPGGDPRSRPSASAPSLSGPFHHGAGRHNERVPPSSGSEQWRDEWLGAEYHNRRAPPRTAVRPRRPAPTPEPIPMAEGRYGGLRDEVPGGDVDWNVGGGEDLDLDLDLEEFDTSPPRGV